MTAPIEDVSTLPGKQISDPTATPIGKVMEIYASDGHPTWVAVELSSGLVGKDIVFIPLARIKDEDGELRVPYTKRRIADAPEIDTSNGISEECDRRLRDHYGIDTGDQELRSDNKSYATLVPDEVGVSQRVENPDELKTPNADTRTEESRRRLHDPGSSETRKVTAGDVAHDTRQVADDDPGADDDDQRSG
jgi:hypothetical protein